MKVQKFELNLVPGGVPVYVHADQYDKGRAFTAVMQDGDEPYIFDGTETITICGTKASGKGFSYDNIASAPQGGSEVTFTLTEQMSVCAGKCVCGIILSKSGYQIGAANFIIMFQPNALQAETIIDSDDFNSIISDAVSAYLDEHGVPITAQATTLAPGSQATASYDNGVLTIGVPRGAKGDQGNRGPAGAGFPAGGDTGQVLRKVSDDDYDTEWSDAPSSDTLGFTDWDFDENGYLHLLDSDDQDVLDPLYIGTGGGGGGGGGADSVVRITRVGSRERSLVDTETTYPLTVTWSSVDSATSETTGNGSASWYVGGRRVAVETVTQGSYTFDIRNYLTDGSTNTVKLTIEDSYGTTKSMSWDITVTSFGLTWNLADVGYDGSDDVIARIIPNGTGEKTVTVSVDGTDIYEEVITSSGRTINVTIPAQSHGAHTVRAWMTATVGGETVTSDVLTHVGIWTVSGTTTPVIAVEDTAFTVQQFGTKNIKFMVYDPQNESVSVTRAIDGTTNAVVTADRTKQVWSYRPTTTGSHTLTLTAGGTTATITVTVTSTGYNIHEVSGAVVDIDPTGHTNNEAGASNFGYKDANGTVHPFTYSSNFDWVNGGFQQDADGITAFVVKRGTYVRLDRSLFNDEPQSGNGKEIKVIFRSANVRSYGAELMNGTATGVGLTINANAATLQSMQETMDALYCEDQKIELDINIEPANDRYNRFVTVWMEGIISGLKVYATDDSWTQDAPAAFKIGSDDCDVWLYRLKMYDTCLTRYDILDNFIADCSDPDEMIDRYERNDIFSAGNVVDINALANASPKLRIIRISADRLTTGKEDPVTTKIEHIYRNGGIADNWTAISAKHKAQGTSSLGYALAALNLDIDMANASSWADAEGEPVTSYAMTENSIPVTYFNIKLNVASSENANNVLLADDYNTYQPWLSPARKANPKVRDTVEGHPCAVFFTNTSNSTITVGSHTVAPGETIFYGCGDMNNSKKNRAVFGQDTSQWPEQCCIEIRNNINPQCLFKSNDLTDETWGEKDGDSFEFRYGESAAAKAKLQQLLDWMVQVDASEATGDPLGRVVNIGGTAYANDTEAYRVAKFRAEVGDYFAVDSLLYHYLFTERHCMVDNRAKNCFISYEYDSTAGKYLWNFTKDYDNDTADGNDNSGGLTFTYGLEDTDSVNSSPVFNASSSALWCMVRDYMPVELAGMFQNRQNEGAWSASRIIQKFEDYQSARPEALVNEDMWAKYITPYLTSGNDDYFKMLYGTKKDQRRQFETYQEIYMASKYSSTLAYASHIELRGTVPVSWGGVTPSGDMTITPYCDMYVTVQYGTAGTVKVRAKKGIATAITAPSFAGLGDVETYIYCAPYITEVSGLAGLYTRIAQLGTAYRLTRLELGSGVAGYSNDRLTGVSLGNNTMLEYIDLRGTPNLVQGLDLSGLPGLKELYVSNSGVTGVTFAVGAIIETAVLPAITKLTARSLLRLTTLTCSATNLASIWIENSPNVDSYSIVAAAPNLTSGRLIDVNWDNADADVILRLVGLAGVDGAEHFELTGSCYISALTASELATIQAAFPYLAITYGSIVNSYTVTFVDYDGTTLYTESVRAGGTAKDPVQKGYIPTPTRAATVDNVYEFLGWDTALGPITVNTTITASYQSMTRRYTVTWMYDAGTVLYSESIAARAGTKYNGAAHNCPTELTPPETGQIWTGWDTLTNSIVEDTVVTAEFITPVLPSAMPSTFDYLYSEDPNDVSALTFAEFYGIIYNGRASSYFTIGDKIKIVPNTTVFADSSIVLQLEAFHHFQLASDGTTWAETTWGMVGLMNANHSMNGSATNVGGWPSCGMRNWLNNTIFPALPQRWKAVIKQVEVLSSAGGTSDTIVSSQDKLFLRSQAEVGFDTSAVPYTNEIAAGADQKRFSMYSSNANRIKKTYNGTGTAANWWTRSPVSSSSANYCYVNGNGNSGTANSATSSLGVSFGFCI